MKMSFCTFFPAALLVSLATVPDAAADVVVGDAGVSCADDPACINRLHPDIPTVANADPGERIVFIGRDAFDLTLDPDEYSSADAIPREGFGIVHALTGPVFINGAKAGDVLAVTIEAFEPADVGWTDAGHSALPATSSVPMSDSSSGASTTNTPSAMRCRAYVFRTPVFRVS